MGGGDLVSVGGLRPETHRRRRWKLAETRWNSGPVAVGNPEVLFSAQGGGKHGEGTDGEDRGWTGMSLVKMCGECGC